MDDVIRLPDVPVAHYRFTLEALEPLHLPPYKGSALRGGFGHTLKRLVCYQSRGDCKKCLLGNDCVYGYLFETSPPEDAEVLRTHEAIPRPFVVQPPFDRRSTFEPGEGLDFHVTLVGRGIAYLPYFTLAFREMGKAGLGRGRGKYVLHEIQAVHPLNDQQQPVYDGEMLLGTELDVAAAEIAAWAEQLPPDRLTVRFLTPTRLKHKGRYAREGPPFHVLIRRLLDRISSLAYFHCGQRWEIDFRAWIERAQDVQIAEATTTWADWERYSGRQDQRVKMGGLVGPVTYTGDVAPYRALLALGTLVHVGKGAVMGNGRLALEGLDESLRT